MKRGVSLKQQSNVLFLVSFLLCDRDAILQRKRLAKRRDYVSAAEGAKLRAELRQLDSEVREAAQEVRRAQEDLEDAQEALEELEVRHWALLSQYEADEFFQQTKQKKSESNSADGAEEQTEKIENSK